MQIQGSSLRERLQGRGQNSFGALRLMFAAAVIVSHAFPLSGRGTDPVYAWTGSQTHVGSLAVYGFLAISGYVVTKSAARLAPGRFAWHRVIRLYPAYWVALIVGGLVISPIAWAMSGRDMSAFWAEPNGPRSYVLRNASLWTQQWDIHDLWAGQPLGISPSTIPGAVNGSMWTLAYELMCYIIIGAFAAWGILNRNKIVVPIAAGLFGLMELVIRIRPGFFAHYVGVLDDSMITLGWVFMLGASAALFADRIPMRHTFGVASLAVMAITLWVGGFHVIGIPAFVYATLWAAAALPRWFHWVGAKNDYSYGLYLYGWPVQVALAAAGLQHKLLLYVALSLLGAAVLAWASWHGVEKWAMKAKDVQLRRARDTTPAPATA